MQNKKLRNTVRSMYLHSSPQQLANSILPEQLEFAHYLDRCYGRQIAKNYLRLVTDPKYLSKERLAIVKRNAIVLERAWQFTKEVERPAEGWKIAAQQHIQKVGDEIRAVQPSISLKELEREISKTYPFGPRTRHPHQVWRKELKSYLSQFKRRGA